VVLRQGSTVTTDVTRTVPATTVVSSVVVVVVM